MDIKELLRINISENWTLDIHIGVLLLIFILLVIIIIFFKLLNKLTFKNDIELNICLGAIGKVKIKPNYQVEQIAHKAWVELITRKAGLPIDLENDVIVEIYNSWYVLFTEMRNLIKEIPINQIKDENTSKIINLLVDSLNKGLRPHLTKWQARFRRWYDNRINKDTELTPQEIQKNYPRYEELSLDLLNVNQQLVSYTNELKKLISI